MANPSTFEAFYEKHLDAVYRFVFFRVQQQREVAEDLTAEIFMAALKAFDRFDPTKGERAWIMTIARNRLINHWRDKKDTIDIDDVAFTLAGEDGRVRADQAEKSREVRQALMKLSKAERTLVEKKYLLGYSHAEIALAEGKNEGAVRIALHRATKKLKILCSGLHSEN